MFALRNDDLSYFNLSNRIRVRKKSNKDKGSKAQSEIVILIANNKHFATLRLYDLCL